MPEFSPITQQFLTQVKEAKIGQLVEADKANWLGNKDNVLSAKEIQYAFMDGTLTRKADAKGNVTSSALYISKEQAQTVVKEITERYPLFVVGGGINFRALKAEIDPEYRKFAEIKPDAQYRPLDENLRSMSDLIKVTNKGQDVFPVRK